MKATSQFVTSRPRAIVGIIAILVAAVVLAINLRPGGSAEKSIYSGVQVFNVIFGPGGSPLNKPSAVAVGINGEIYVIDEGNRRIAVFEENGKYRFSFSGDGSGLAELKQPVSITVSFKGNVYVADKEKEEIIAYNANGGYLFTLREIESGRFIPSGMTIDEKDRIYVFNEYDKSLYTFTEKEKKLSKVPSKDDLNVMGELCRGPEGVIFGTDPEDKQIVRLEDAAPEEAFGQTYLKTPAGIAFDPFGKKLFASDYLKGKIVVFDQRGNYLGEFGSPGEEKNCFQNPEGLTVDPRGKLYVADRGNNRIVIYQFE